MPLYHALLQCAETTSHHFCNKQCVWYRSVRSTIATILLLAGALTAAANIWGTGPINARMQAHVAPQVAHVLGREVCVNLEQSRLVTVKRAISTCTNSKLVVGSTDSYVLTYKPLHVGLAGIHLSWLSCACASAARGTQMFVPACIVPVHSLLHNYPSNSKAWLSD